VGRGPFTTRLWELQKGPWRVCGNRKASGVGVGAKIRQSLGFEAGYAVWEFGGHEVGDLGRENGGGKIIRGAPVFCETGEKQKDRNRRAMDIRGKFALGGEMFCLD